MKNIIEIKDLSKCYGDLAAVNHISFQVKKGELFAFLGTNGAGKSTEIFYYMSFYVIKNLRKNYCRWVRYGS